MTAGALLAGGGGFSRDASRPPRVFGNNPGDWTCPQCQATNYAHRNTCFRCQNEKPDGATATIPTVRTEITVDTSRLTQFSRRGST